MIPGVPECSMVERFREECGCLLVSQVMNSEKRRAEGIERKTLNGNNMAEG